MMFPKAQRRSITSTSRVVLLGDPHGDVRTAQRIADRERAIDRETVIACVGDAIGYADGPTSSAMVDWLEHNEVPTVLGNHEEWYFHQDQLAVIEDRLAQRGLSDSAKAWIAQLPHRIDLCDSTSGAVLAAVVHSIRTPSWDDVQPHTASRLMRELKGIKLVFVGHTHCARVLTYDNEGVVSSTGLDYNKNEILDVDLNGVPSAIVDSGSISRPRLDLRQLDRAARFGTYAVVDLGRNVVSLRRIERATA